MDKLLKAALCSAAAYAGWRFYQSRTSAPASSTAPADANPEGPGAREDLTEEHRDALLRELESQLDVS